MVLAAGLKALEQPHGLDPNRWLLGMEAEAAAKFVQHSLRRLEIVVVVGHLYTASVFSCILSQQLGGVLTVEVAGIGHASGLARPADGLPAVTSRLAIATRSTRLKIVSIASSLLAY